MNFTLINVLCLSFFLLGLVQVSFSQDVCEGKLCGNGKCVADSFSIFEYNCVCDGGWKQFQLGPLVLPPCLLPNCTINMDCGNGAPSPPPPPFQLPPINFTDPCNLVLCGDGSCVGNGTSHICQCNQGATNMLNFTALACIKPCSLGADCSGLGLSQYVAPSPPTNTNGGSHKSKCSRNYALSLLLSITIVALVQAIFS